MHYQDQLFYKALKKQERILSPTFSLDPASAVSLKRLPKPPQNNPIEVFLIIY